MNKRLFLSELGQRLEDIPYREAMRVLNYYEEAIDDRIEDGMSEEAAVEAMGSVDDIAREILGENEVNETAEAAEEPAKTMAETVMETEKESGSNPFFSFEYDSNKKRGSFKTGGNDGDPSRAARVFEVNEVREIRVEELAGDLEVSASSDGRIHVESEDWRGLTCELLADGTLAVSRRRVRKNGKFLGISFDFDYAPTGDVRILLPEEYEGSFAVSTLSGDVRICDVSPDALRLKTLSGDVSLARVSVYSL
ncbi:MAG: DUF1700 domain-containing protein, partial [Firmicutes bacterium]|nr:DUF1700 domain-containing protein [Bacillota bacterium]